MAPHASSPTTSIPSAHQPCLPTATQVAFSERGRIGVLNVASGVVRPLTLGVDHEDSAPSWRPDGKALVVSALRRSTGRTSLDVLDLEAKDPGAIRTPVTSGSGSDDTAPLFAPDGQSVVFVREETLHRVSLVDGRTVRITGGFRTWRTPRYLASGRLVAQWTQAKQFGLAVMDADGKNLEILWQGAIRYRGLAPSPDDRYVAASYGYDLQFHLTEALGLRHDGEIRLLDRSGLFVARLAGGLRERAHSADWGPARSPAGDPAAGPVTPRPARSMIGRWHFALAARPRSRWTSSTSTRERSSVAPSAVSTSKWWASRRSRSNRHPSKRTTPGGKHEPHRTLLCPRRHPRARWARCSSPIPGGVDSAFLAVAGPQSPRSEGSRRDRRLRVPLRGAARSSRGRGAAVRLRPPCGERRGRSRTLSIFATKPTAASTARPSSSEHSSRWQRPRASPTWPTVSSSTTSATTAQASARRPKRASERRWPRRASARRMFERFRGPSVFPRPTCRRRPALLPGWRTECPSAHLALRKVEAAEAAVRSLGFRELRVRHLGQGARVEIAPAELIRLRAEPGLGASRPGRSPSGGLRCGHRGPRGLSPGPPQRGADNDGHQRIRFLRPAGASRREPVRPWESLHRGVGGVRAD